MDSTNDYGSIHEENETLLVEAIRNTPYPKADSNDNCDPNKADEECIVIVYRLD